MNILNKLEIRNVSHKFEDKYILEDINFSIEDNKTIAIIGPSGVGKTTLFNIISGLLKPTKGNVYLANKDITNKTGNVSYMLQKDLLLPFRTVFENISLPLEIKGEKKEIIRKKINDNLEAFGLKGLENKYPKELSGGQKQRVALLRTYMFSSSVILLDEPFSSLDFFTKNKMYSWFNSLKKELNLSCLLITHDIDEAIYLADKIYILLGNPAKLVYEVDIPKDLDILSLEILNIKKEILKKLGAV